MKKSLIFHRIYAKKISFILHTAFKKKKITKFHIFGNSQHLYSLHIIFIKNYY